MKKGVKIILFFFAFGLMVCVTQPVKAQCAMCAATVESSANNGSNKTHGLNNGIMYLLAAPYIAVAVLGYVWYKKYRRKNVELNMRDEKLNLN